MCDPECIKIKNILIRRSFMNNLSIRKMNELSKKKKKGFTLVELIIVIAIIAILAAIAIPKFGEIRENANVKADIATAKNIQTAAIAAVSNGTIPLPTTATPSPITITDMAASGTTAATKGVLEGTTAPVPKSKEAVAKGTTLNVFAATVDSNGTVAVTAGGIQVLPTPASPYDK
jgi:type IV pilus assembly protein PilA